MGVDYENLPRVRKKKIEEEIRENILRMEIEEIRKHIERTYGVRIPIDMIVRIRERVMKDIGVLKKLLEIDFEKIDLAIQKLEKFLELCYSCSIRCPILARALGITVDGFPEYLAKEQAEQVKELETKGGKFARLVEIFKKEKRLTVKEIMRRLRITRGTAYSYLSKLKRTGLIRRIEVTPRKVVYEWIGEES